ncbi:tRNA-splicing endonuclease subunit Sen15 domain-containing protein [Plasmodiophora brassicae]|uniref:tRNA-splicing endonuclease subunit Sen15 domain-containing protein n=1 Tax=Plasmodiophora brassicae TaxID=37360 RepID=A0A3P3Y121_PLABS|nr:unnamed protein product [Plasmodiophora brassicae]
MAASLHDDLGEFDEFVRRFPKYREQSELVHLVYNDLRLVKQWADVAVMDAPKIGSYLITGVPYAQNEKEVVLPRWVYDDVTPGDLHAILHETSSRCVLAFADSDSTLSYYAIDNGIAAMPIAAKLSSDKPDVDDD